MHNPQGRGRTRAAALLITTVLVVALWTPPAASVDDYEHGDCIVNDGIGAHPFTDVSGGAFYAEAVAWLFANGITVGIAPTLFGPDEPVTRAQFATMLHRMACLPAPGGVASFVDLRAGAFYRAAVDWMVGEGITTGKTPTMFGPDDFMTRGEFAAFMHRFVGEPDTAPVAVSFGDVDRSRFFARPVDWLVFRSVTQGTSPTTFSPERLITRGELATFLYRLNTISDVRLAMTTVLTGLSAPTAATVDPTTGDIYIAERAGTMHRVPVGPGGSPDFASMHVALEVDAGNAVISGGSNSERGLLGVAVAPDGDHIYVNFTADADSGYPGVVDGDSVVVEYALAGGVIAPGSARLVIEVDQPQSNHNAGQVVFGPDGFLYTSFGDGGGGNDDDAGHTPGIGNGQDTTNLLGSIIRIDVSTSPGYAVPASNPFVGAAGADEIWLYGVRNPWKFTFDRMTGDLWVADVGQGALEEITRLEAHLGGGRGANLGWRLREGTIATPGSVGGPAPPGHVGPVHVYANGADGCSFTGGFVYRGMNIPALDGVYIYSDFCNPTIRAWRDDHGVEAVDLEVSVPGVQSSAFFEDMNGELYTVSLGGTVARLDRAIS